MAGGVAIVRRFRPTLSTELRKIIAMLATNRRCRRVHPMPDRSILNAAFRDPEGITVLLSKSSMSPERKRTPSFFTPTFVLSRYLSVRCYPNLESDN